MEELEKEQDRNKMSRENKHKTDEKLKAPDVNEEKESYGKKRFRKGRKMEMQGGDKDKKMGTTNGKKEKKRKREVGSEEEKEEGEDRGDAKEGKWR